MFVDQVKIFAKAGKGGKGCVAFLREKFRPKGGPSGGNGGRGGDVILRADHDMNNLVNQYYQSRLIAKDGQGGMGKEMDGRSGKNLVIRVPCGTLIWQLERIEPEAESAEPTPQKAQKAAESEADDANDAGDDRPALMATSQRPVIRYAGAAVAQEINLGEDEDEAPESGAYVPPEERAELVADLTEHGQEFVLCKGGKGGLGNKNFKSSVRQTPRISTPGEMGDEGYFRFELRILAEVGLDRRASNNLERGVDRNKPIWSIPPPFLTEALCTLS